MSLPAELLCLASRPLLVVLDYDGTLAPIVNRPEDALPQAGAVAALRALHEDGRHRAVVLTGRPASEPSAFLATPGIAVVGLHGMEWPDSDLAPPDRPTIEGLRASLPAREGVTLEDKGRTLAVHYRNAPEGEHAAIEAELDALPAPAGWEVVRGKKVREFRPEGFGKGRAVQRLAREHPGLHPVFIGDDVTDEEGFAALNALGGTTVKVGEGDTVARHRLPDPAAVVPLLEAWASRRC